MTRLLQSAAMKERRILVVEDERTIAESVAARLRAEGFAVELAARRARPRSPPPAATSPTWSCST